MKTSAGQPTVTDKFHIEVPTHKYLSVASVFKVYFGKKYLIWKGKSLLQSCQFLAEGIERYIRMRKNIDTDYLYHVCAHIKRTRCIHATVDVIANDFQKPDSEAINGFRMLKLEQELLDKAKNDELCLNNNVDAYIPGWINRPHVERFEKFLIDKRKPKKRVANRV